MRSIFFVRLGETENNVSGKWSGRKSDSPLTLKGHEQSRAIAAKLLSKNIVAVYSSPSSRVIDSAKYLTESIKKDIIPTYEFQEIDLGDFDGKEGKDAAQTEIGNKFTVNPSSICIPGATETLEESKENALAKISSILAENLEGSIAVYTHGGTMRLIILGLLGIGPDLSCFWRFRIGNSAVAHIAQQQNGSFELQDLVNFGGVIL